MSTAKVQSIEAVKTFRLALLRFAEVAGGLLNMPAPNDGASSSMHEKCRWSPKGIALDCTCPTVMVGGAALALAWSWWRRSRRPWRGPMHREGVWVGLAGRASRDNTPVVRLRRRPTVAHGTVVV